MYNWLTLKLILISYTWNSSNPLHQLNPHTMGNDHVWIPMPLLFNWSFERKTYTWSSRKSSHCGFQVVKSTQNLIKSDVSTKTLQFGGCMEGAMTPDFMKSRVIAPLLHSSNWIVKSKDHLQGIVTLCLGCCWASSNSTGCVFPCPLTATLGIIIQHYHYLIRIVVFKYVSKENYNSYHVNLSDSVRLFYLYLLDYITRRTLILENQKKITSIR